MMPIKDLLNKIKWDQRERPEDYTLFYYDRVNDKLKEIDYCSIKKIEDNFFILEGARKEVAIPLHRIKKVKKKGIVVWER
jgi:uncharacterized protein (UPF0248 family)